MMTYGDDMNIKGLRVFTQIMLTGTLAAAARNMHSSESALSRQLALLEAELGLTLFSREKRRLVPTAEGEAFYREAERILDAIEQIPEIVDEIKRGPKRRLRLIVMPRMAPAIAAPAVTRYLQENPDVEISVEVQQRLYLERWVAAHQFDLGIGALPAHHSAIETEAICALPPVAVLHPDHPLAGRSRIAMQELRGEHFITLPPHTLIHRQTARLLDEAEIHPASRIQVSQTIMGVNFVALGLGVIITDAMIPQLFGDRVKLVPIETPMRLSFGLLYPRGVAVPDEVPRLVEIIKEHSQAYVESLNFN